MSSGCLKEDRRGRKKDERNERQNVNVCWRLSQQSITGAAPRVLLKKARLVTGILLHYVCTQCAIN